MVIMNKIITGVIMAALILVTGCSNQPPSPPNPEITPTPMPLDETTISLLQYDTLSTSSLTIVTSLGEISIELYNEEAPKAVENFTLLAEGGYYNGLRFNFAQTNGRIQSGDPEDGSGGVSIWQEPFPVEITNNLWNFSGAVGMVTDSDGNNSSQFYIISETMLTEDTILQMSEGGFPTKVISKYQDAGGMPWLDGKNTVFGQVVDGMEVVNAISQLSTDENHRPIEDVIIEEIIVK